MADAILSAAVRSFGKLSIEEGNFLQGVSDQVNQLHDDLKRVEWFVKRADTKQSARESVQPWISEFEAIAYEANDLVEDYALRVAFQNKAGVKNTLKRYVCIFSEFHARHNLGKKIQSLRNRISVLTKNLGDYGVPAIIEGEGSSSLQQQLRRTYSFFSKSEEDFVGLESDVSLLVKYLVNEVGFEHKSVVSICGMGGIGKTTLAKKVYHHSSVKQEFQGFAWFCISQQRSTKEILQGILVKLVPEQEQQIKAREEERLVGQLREVLQRRRCLIILDDIWSNDAWDCIKPAFCISENGSKILLTTRNRDVAEHVDPNGYHHQPRFLTNEESWELLEKKSLKNRSAQGKYREDSDIEIERLYQLWIVEDMVLASDRIGQETMMDVAERYLEELAKRCMIQVELNEEGQTAITRFKSCRLHDLMRDLCLDKAKEENLYKVIDLGHPSANSSPAIERHYGIVLRYFGN